MKKVILWRMNSLDLVLYAFSTPHTQQTGTVDISTVNSFQNCQEDESLYVAIILRNTKKTHSVRHGHLHGFDQT